jgi:hypothetical protein
MAKLGFELDLGMFRISGCLPLESILVRVYKRATFVVVALIALCCADVIKCVDRHLFWRSTFNQYSLQARVLCALRWNSAYSHVGDRAATLIDRP